MSEENDTSDTPNPTQEQNSYGRSIVFLGRERSPAFVTESTRLPARLTSGQVLVKVELATICGSDLHTLNGTRTTAQPCILGHEGSGLVVASAREGMREGQRVTWGVCASCNKCLYCSIGLENKCKTLQKCGHTLVSAAPLFGTYSTHVLCPAGTPVVPLPPALTPTLAAPINCALATMVNALSKVPPSPPLGQPGASVALVQGAGMLGMYASALLKEAGFSKVFCVDVNRVRLTRVAEFGAIPVHHDQEEEVIPTGSVDVVFEVCGNKEVVNQGVRVLRQGGTYVLVGLVCPSDAHLPVTALVLKCLTVVGVHNYTAKHLQQAVTFMERHHDHYPFASLVGLVYPLTDFRARRRWSKRKKGGEVGKGKVAEREVVMQRRWREETLMRMVYISVCRGSCSKWPVLPRGSQPSTVMHHGVCVCVCVCYKNAM